MPQSEFDAGTDHPGPWAPLIEPHREALVAEARPCVYLVPGLLPSPYPLAPWASNLCGLPYLLKDAPLPAGKKSKLFMVAQLNFAELPVLPGWLGVTEPSRRGDRISPYPSRGILQFWLDESLEQAKTIFIADPIDDPARLMTVEEYRAASGPFTSYDGFFTRKRVKGFRPCRVTTVKKPMLPHQFDLEAASLIERELGARDGEKWAAYHDADGGPAWPLYPHWMGGFFDHADGDPRTAIDPPRDAFRVLLHLGTDDIDDQPNIDFGDGGDATWFIEESALAAGEFEKTFFYWDE